MCEAKPGTRCPADTRAPYRKAVAAYAAAHPTGPSLDPLTAAQHRWKQPAPKPAPTPRMVTTTGVPEPARAKFRTTQSLAYAVGLAEHLDVPVLHAAFDRDRRLIHAWVSPDDVRIRDIDGERDLDSYARTLDSTHPGWSQEVLTPQEARQHAQQWTEVPQQWVSASRVAAQIEQEQHEPDWWS